MIELTDSAQKQLQGYFADKEITPIRVYLSAGGWAGPRLSLALDEPRDTDDSFSAGGFTFLVDKALGAQTGDIRIDMTYYGFTVDSANPVGGGGGCSSGSCSTGSCSSSGSSCSC